MVKPKLTQSQRRKARKARAAAAALTGPPPPTTGPRDGAVHRVVLPAARGRQSGLKRQVEMVVKHYHFYQQIVSGGSVFPPNILGGQDMSVPPPVTVLSEPNVVQSHQEVVQSHPKVQTPKTGHKNSNKPGPQQKTVVRARSGKPILTLWGSSHLAENHLLGPDLKVKLEAHFQHVINLSEGGAKLRNVITEQIEIAMRSHPGPNQVYVIEFGSNNMRKTTKPALEVAKIVSRYHRIMAEAQKAKVRVLLCGTIPDPRPAVDSKLELLDEALKDLEMGEGNRFLTLRSSMLDAGGKVRTDIFKPRGDIHLNVAGTQIASLRIRKMLEVMIPTLAQTPAPVHAPVHAPVQTTAKPQRVRILAPVPDPAPVVVNAPPVVNTPLVAADIQAPVVIHAPVVAVQDQVESMETNEDEILARLFFKKYGRALPDEKKKEKEKEKENDVDNIKFVIDLTDDTEEMEDETTPPLVPIIKTEPIEVAEAPEINTNVADVAKRRSFRLERLELAKARKHITEFGKSLRKTDVILEKEAPLAASNIIADTDSDMSEDKSVDPESVTTVNTVKTVEQAIAETDAAIAANQKDLDEFDNKDV
jgi:hypothetical protein